ncbi:DNA mismatch repair endonuclease MutH [Shewanella sp. 202IG2-18]|uniref:DNA mismatch repair endonuclease MutH n=1 Tax=Parashewanella hymeniacidonis TaxID=2807618 RepID=UPI001960E9A0|nr:DNA mismatch repair endonuclease MutH [Parashewanella hymeniacidonis]MBM7074121.1 DNA mismatch repair endonuclease MutH [Parashewanella hymeniacidonis]
MKSAPKSINELLSRATDIAGLTLAHVAELNHAPVPKDLKRDKGWVGQLIEAELGATAGSKAEQDFQEIGVELKTIPINQNGKPIETTFVTFCSLMPPFTASFEDSVVFKKIQRVLWVPIEGDRDIPVRDRRIGTPFLWQPDQNEFLLLKQDWEEIIELISLGKVETITARYGEVMQLRPKAANSKALTETIDEFGKIIQVNPRGFYLKTSFTSRILAKAFG